MADLIVIGYNDEATADAALEEVSRLQGQMILQVEGAGAVIKHEDGKMTVHAPGTGSAGSGAGWGVIWGTAFGMLFFVPFIGAAVGGALGAMFGGLDKAGIDSAFRERVQAQLKPGTSALVMLIDKVTPDKATEALSHYGGTVLKTSLSHDAEQHLQGALREDARQAS